MVPVVGVIMGSDSDWEVMQAATQVLEKFGVRFEAKVVSAHRTPLAMVEYAKLARDRGFKVLIAGAGGAAHLPGMVASLTSLPVIGVPVKSKSMSGLDSLYSIVQMPAGIPVATMAIDGAANAGLLAVRILSLSEPSLAKDLESYASEMEQKVAAMNERLQKTP